MDFLQFLAGSEWPVVVAGGLWVFREPIKQKLLSATKASGPFGMNVEFEKLEKAVEKTESVVEVVESARQELEKHKAELDSEAFVKLTTALKNVAAANNSASSTLSEMLPDSPSFRLLQQGKRRMDFQWANLKLREKIEEVLGEAEYRELRSVADAIAGTQPIIVTPEDVQANLRKRARAMIAYRPELQQRFEGLLRE